MMARALLVCAEPCERVEKRIALARYQVIKVMNGEAAVSIVGKMMFDAAVLVSTGKEINLAETFLSLSDARPLMPILIVSAKNLPLGELETHLKAVKIFGEKSIKDPTN